MPAGAAGAASPSGQQYMGMPGVGQMDHLPQAPGPGFLPGNSGGPGSAPYPFPSQFMDLAANLGGVLPGNGMLGPLPPGLLEGASPTSQLPPGFPGSLGGGGQQTGPIVLGAGNTAGPSSADFLPHPQTARAQSLLDAVAAATNDAAGGPGLSGNAATSSGNNNNNNNNNVNISNQPGVNSNTTMLHDMGAALLGTSPPAFGQAGNIILPPPAPLQLQGSAAMGGHNSGPTPGATHLPSATPPSGFPSTSQPLPSPAAAASTLAVGQGKLAALLEEYTRPGAAVLAALAASNSSPSGPPAPGAAQPQTGPSTTGDTAMEGVAGPHAGAPQHAQSGRSGSGPPPGMCVPVGGGSLEVSSSSSLNASAGAQGAGHQGQGQAHGQGPQGQGTGDEYGMDVEENFKGYKRSRSQLYVAVPPSDGGPWSAGNAPGGQQNQLQQQQQQQATALDALAALLQLQGGGPAAAGQQAMQVEDGGAGTGTSQQNLQQVAMAAAGNTSAAGGQSAFTALQGPAAVGTLAAAAAATASGAWDPSAAPAGAAPWGAWGRGGWGAGGLGACTTPSCVQESHCVRGTHALFSLLSGSCQFQQATPGD
jgi:hypothetical protein